MGISNPRLSVPRDPPVWCEAETGSAANITPELSAEREKALSKHGRRRAVINPRPRKVGRSGRLGAATRVVPQRFIFRLCLLGETKAIFYWRKQFPARTGGCGLPRPVTGAEEIRVSFRDQSADWSWKSVIPLHKSKGDADCHSQCAHWLRNDTLQGVR